MNILGLEYLKELYKDDVDLNEAYESCQSLVRRDRSHWLDYMLQEGMMFKGIQLCIPKCSMKEYLIQEKHSGCLVKHFENDKMYVKISSYYFFRNMRVHVQIFVGRFRVCQ